MGHLEFEKLTVKNSRAFRGEHVLTLNSPGLNLLRGRNLLEPALGANDAGKTTLWDTFSWVLWGKTPNGLRGADLRPWGDDPKDGGPTQGAVFLSHDGAAHVVSRVDKTNGLKLDGKAVGQGDIDRLVMPFELATSTILLAQGRPLLFDKPPREKLELFADTLNLQRWDVRSEFAAERLKTLTLKTEQLQGQFDAKKAMRDETARAMKTARDKSDAWQQAQADKIERLRDELMAAEKDLEKQAKLKADADLKYDGAGTEAKAIKQELEQLGQVYDEARNKLNKAEAALEQAHRDRKRLEGELSRLRSSSKCPTCGSAVTNKNFAKHKGELEKQLDDVKARINKGAPRGLIREVEALKRSIDKQREYEREFLEKAEEGLSSLRRLSDVVGKLEAKIQTLKFTIDHEEHAENVFYTQYMGHKKTVATLARELEDIDADISKNERLVARTRPWVKGFKEIRLLIVDEVLEELELATNAMLPEMGLADWEVQYDIEKETKSGGVQRALNVTILSPRNDKPVKWETWGGGVGQRLRIVGALSFSDVLLTRAGITTNLEILDEPARHMSKTGVRDLCDALSARAEALNRCIWFVDHMSIESDRFSEVCTVVKDERGSRLKWG